MKRTVVLAVSFLSLLWIGSAQAETAIGAQFGYPGNVGLSMRFDRTAFSAAWSEDFLHGTLDAWFIKKPVGEDPKLSWYAGPGIDAGIPLDDAEEFFLAGRVPLGLQFMISPKLETFGEVSAGLQVMHDVDFYWSSCLGIRMVLGK